MSPLATWQDVLALGKQVLHSGFNCFDVALGFCWSLRLAEPEGWIPLIQGFGLIICRKYPPECSVAWTRQMAWSHPCMWPGEQQMALR